MLESAKIHDIPVTEMHLGTVNNLDNFMSSLQSKTGIEGIVIRFDDDGTMFKVKTQWYFDRSKKEKQEFSFNSERTIWRLILDQQVDDALVFMNDVHLSKRVKEFEIKLFDAISQTSKKLSEIADKYRNLERKLYVAAVQKETGVPKEAQSILFKLYDKPTRATIDVLIEEVKKNCNSVTSLERARKVLGGQINFEE